MTLPARSEEVLPPVTPTTDGVTLGAKTEEESVDGTDANTPAARLDLFGGPRLTLHTGADLRLSPTQQALLTLLAGHEARGLSRRQAIWLLWEEPDEPRPRQRLRQLLHDLRGRIGIDRFTFGTDGLLVQNPRLVRCDVDDFRASLRTGELGRAAALLERGFASRLKRVPGQEFEDWVDAKRAAFRRDLRDCAANAWDVSHPSGAWRQAREAAEVLHALNPEPDESILRKVIESRVMTGNAEGAEAAFTAHVEALPPGAALEQETIDLLHRVRRLTPHITGESRKAHEPPPLVGRQPDLEAARATLRRVREGTFEFLLVRGEAGVGKTRLLEEIRREAYLKGFRCLRARPVELEQKIPLNPLIDALDDPDVGRHLRSLEDPWRAVIASILPELPAGMDRPVVPPIEESALSRRLYDAFSILFSRLAAEEPTLLFIDDLQWADATTIAVLQFVQRRWRAGPLGVIASMRPELIPNGGRGAAKYLEESRELPVTTIELRDLGEADAERLVDLVGEGRVESPVRRRLCALGGRNPFYLIELTKDYLSGQLQLPELPNDAITIPISLRQLVDPRLRSLSSAASAAAEHLAVWGRQIALADLAGLSGIDIGRCVERIEELERFRLVSVERGRVRLAHELFRGVLYHRMSDARRALLHRDIAEYLLSIDQHSLGELAIHFSRAGESGPAARFGRKAADEALEKGAMAEAAYFLQVVTENVGDARLKAEATADLARVLHMSREIARAVPLLELAAKRLRETGGHARALRMDIRRVEGLAEVGATPMPDLLDRLASIKHAARDAHDWEALALALDSELHLLHRVGEVSAIRKLFTEIRECAMLGDPAASCLANASLALNILFGDGDEALDRAREAVRVAEREVPAHVFRAQSRLALALIYTGSLGSEEARILLRQAAARAESSGDLTLKFYLESNRGVFFMDAGDLDLAEATFEHAAPLLERTEPGTPHLNLYYNRGELDLQRHRYDQAASWFQKAEQLISPAAPVYLVDLVNAGLGLCALELGHLVEAREMEEKTSRSVEHWYFDPTTLVTFHSRLLMRRGQGDAALGLIRDAQASVRGRLILAWIKLVLLEAHVERRLRRKVTAPLAEALLLARRLGLTNRVSGIEALSRGGSPTT